MSQPRAFNKRWLYALRREPPYLIGKLLGVVCIALVLLVWWYVTRGEVEQRIITKNILPSPGEVFGSLGGPEGLLARGLIRSIASTLQRVFIGFGLAILVGGFAGIIAGAWRPLHAFVAPLVLFGRSLPLAALIPLTIAWFGIDDTQKFMFIFIATVPFIFSDTAAAVMSIHERYVETAQTLGASRLQIITKVLIPLALPKVYTSIRFLFGLGFGYIMLAEVINADAGLGHLIMTSQRRAIYEHIYMLLLIIGLLAYLIDRLLAFFQKGLFPYKKEI